MLPLSFSEAAKFRRSPMVNSFNRLAAIASKSLREGAWWTVLPIGNPASRSTRRCERPLLPSSARTRTTASAMIRGRSGFGGRPRRGAFGTVNTAPRTDASIPLIERQAGRPTLSLAPSHSRKTFGSAFPRRARITSRDARGCCQPKRTALLPDRRRPRLLRRGEHARPQGRFAHPGQCRGDPRARLKGQGGVHPRRDSIPDSRISITLRAPSELIQTLPAFSICSRPRHVPRKCGVLSDHPAATRSPCRNTCVTWATYSCFVSSPIFARESGAGPALVVLKMCSQAPTRLW